jgi:hypothetical protein
LALHFPFREEKSLPEESINLKPCYMQYILAI